MDYFQSTLFGAWELGCPCITTHILWNSMYGMAMHEIATQLLRDHGCGLPIRSHHSKITDRRPSVPNHVLYQAESSQNLTEINIGRRSSSDLVNTKKKPTRLLIRSPHSRTQTQPTTTPSLHYSIHACLHCLSYPWPPILLVRELIRDMLAVDPLSA